MLKTQIAHGSPNKQGTADAHGAPLGEVAELVRQDRLVVVESLELEAPKTKLLATKLKPRSYPSS